MGKKSAILMAAIFLGVMVVGILVALLLRP